LEAVAILLVVVVSVRRVRSMTSKIGV